MKEETAPTCIIVRGKPADSKNLTNQNSIYNVTMGNCCVSLSHYKAAS
jgi:hypothetical protein